MGNNHPLFVGIAGPLPEVASNLLRFQLYLLYTNSGSAVGTESKVRIIPFIPPCMLTSLTTDMIYYLICCAILHTRLNKRIIQRLQENYNNFMVMLYIRL